MKIEIGKKNNSSKHHARDEIIACILCMKIIRHDKIYASVPQNRDLIFISWQYCGICGRRTLFCVGKSSYCFVGKDNDILKNNEVEFLWEFLHKNIAF